MASKRDAAIVTHDEVIARLVRAREAVTLRRAANGFVASLTSAPRRYRTGLVSFALAAHLQPHPLRPYDTRPKPKVATCLECGLRARQSLDLSDHRESLERGDSLPGEVLDAMVDLEGFADLEDVRPTAADWAALNGLLRVIANAPRTARHGAIAKAIHRERRALGLDGVVTDWRYLLETLAQIGALEVDGRPGLLRQWTAYVVRDQRPGRTDVPAPLAWWTRAHGVRRDALERVFGRANLRLPRGIEPGPDVPPPPRPKKPRDSGLEVGDVVVVRLEPSVRHAMLVTGLTRSKSGVYPVVVDLGVYDGPPDPADVLARAKRRAREKTPRARRASHGFLAKRGGKALTERIGHVDVKREDDCISCGWYGRLDGALRWTEILVEQGQS
jgi:hypothetical protein